jgi:TRAP-type uncharacterized transport system fused permease subunit
MALLVLAAVSSIILGMGVSVIVAYIMVALVTVPSMTALGITISQANMFALYFATMGFVTPPIAIAAVVAAKMADAPLMKTALEASKVAVAGFIVPFLFIYDPMLLLMPGNDMLFDLLLLVDAFILLISLQAVICDQYFTRLGVWGRLVSSAVSLIIFLAYPLQNYVLAIIGSAGFVLFTMWQWNRKKTRLFVR